MTKLTIDTIKGLLWALIGTGGQAIIQLGVLVVLARLLSPKEFGLVAAAQVIVAFATIFTQLGVGPAIVQRSKLELRHLRVAFTISCLLGIAFTIIIALSSEVIAEFFRMPDLVPVIRLMSLAFLLKSLSVVPESLLKRELQFRKLAGIEILSLGLGFGGVGIGLALTGYGMWSLVIAYMVQYALTSLILLLVQPHPKIPSVERSALIELLTYGGGFTLGRIGNYLAGQGDNLVVGRALGADALGIYGRAYQLMVAPVMLLGQVLDRVLFPAMAKVQNQPERLGMAYQRGVSLIASVTLPLSAFLVIAAPEIIELLLGRGWDQVVLPFQILAVGTLFRTSYKMSDSLSRATGAVYRRAWRQGVYAFCVIGGAYIGSKWGLVGVSMGVLGAIIINFTLMAQLSLCLAHLSWRGFLTANAAALPLTTVVAVQSWFLMNFLRTHLFSPISTLFILLLIIGFTTLILALVARKIFIGQNGEWIIHSLIHLIKGKSLESKNA
jgi:O-antigen/teichoic acid export membrane protein